MIVVAEKPSRPTFGNALFSACGIEMTVKICKRHFSIKKENELIFCYKQKNTGKHLKIRFSYAILKKQTAKGVKLWILIASFLS